MLFSFKVSKYSWFNMWRILSYILFFTLFNSIKFTASNEYCDLSTDECLSGINYNKEKALFYDVNPSEGFNLRRDVYMRLAMMMAQARKNNKRTDWKLVLPPWYRLYHWRHEYFSAKAYPWSAFFDVLSLKSYAPVVDLLEVSDVIERHTLVLDRVYVLQNYADAFTGGAFVEKWSINNDNECDYKSDFWGYKNITVKEKICVYFQGRAGKLLELLSLHPLDTKIMIAQAQIALHDDYGGKQYWKCRKSMKFSKTLLKAADNYIKSQLHCKKEKCPNYVSIHWRRRDFARSRKDSFPSIPGTAKQITKLINSLNLPKQIFLATDATPDEVQSLILQLRSQYSVYYYSPSGDDIMKFGDAGVAIIDQIVCSRATYFVGSYESTFTFRIQEEREILGFPSNTTFNRLCPDAGKCDKMTKWKIVE